MPTQPDRYPSRASASVFAALALLAVVAPSSADAYIDPGTGSYYVQLIAAAVGGVALFVRQLWYRIRHPSSPRSLETVHDDGPIEGGDSTSQRDDRAS